LAANLVLVGCILRLVPAFSVYLFIWVHSYCSSRCGQRFRFD